MRSTKPTADRLPPDTILAAAVVLAWSFGAADLAVAGQNPTPPFPAIESILLADGDLDRVVATHAGEAAVRAHGTAQAQPVVGLLRDDGFVIDGRITVTYVRKTKKAPARWKIVAKSVKAKDAFSLAGYVTDGASAGTATVKSKRGNQKKTVTRKGVAFSLVLATDAPRPARLDSGFYAKLSLPVGASMARAHEVRLLDDGQTMVAAGTAVFPNDGTPTNFRPCAWILTVNDDGTLTETFVPLWGALGAEGEARCVGPNGDIGGALRTANAFDVTASGPETAGVPCVWTRSGMTFTPTELLDPFPEGDEGVVHAFGLTGVAGRTAGMPFDSGISGPPVFKAGPSGGTVYDCAVSSSVQVGFVNAKPVRWFGTTMTTLQNTDAGYALGCSPSGNWASGLDTRLDAIACVWDARGRLTRLTKGGATFHGSAWAITDAGETFGTRYFTERVDDGADQSQDTVTFVKPVGSTDVLDWSGYLGTLTGTTWLSGYDASVTGEIPESFLGGDTRRSSWGNALAGWTSADNAFVLWAPHP